MKRIYFIALTLLLALYPQNSNSQNIYKEDFLEFWGNCNVNYAYFDEQGIDWNKVKEIYLPATDTIKSKYEFTCFLEQVINEFHNGHISLNQNYTTSNRILPSGSDVFAEKKGNSYYITDVRSGSKAQICGLKPGMEIIIFNGQPVDVQIQKFLPKSIKEYTPAMYEYALNMLLAGTYDVKREFTIKDKGLVKKYAPDDLTVSTIAKLLDYKILDGGIGYIKFNNSLGNYDLIQMFDRALDSLINTKGLILDLTETPGGGNTTIARGIMGRFTTKESAYQKHVIDEKQYGTVRSWIEYVVPRKQIYKGDLVVMVGHWTGSMGEGIAIGFDAMKRAKIVGTKMAGLLGAIYGFSMKNNNINYQIPCEKMYHVNGTPREKFVPKYLSQNNEETYMKALKLLR